MEPRFNDPAVYITNDFIYPDNSTIIEYCDPVQGEWPNYLKVIGKEVERGQLQTVIG